ncbi:DUF5339 domain-containing protein [Mannheimia massilioguelmaensis]|uniref:DUF5339 domain-containing protein n=1 Tax=Mannheimia massilioguelmaensis TaxID=1604354 RepID=UPI0005C8C32A|nr:DUF5339 domain-containing protein [Mannheimia massilioguelmaensis]
MQKTILAVLFAAVASFASAADLSATCKQYFSDIDEYVKAVPAEQSSMMKQQLDASKQQISAMPADTQEQACKQGIESLKQMKTMMPK